MTLHIPPPPAEDHDSFTAGLAAAARSRKGRTLLARLWPFVLAGATAVAGWIASKADSKAELAQAIALAQGQQQVLAAIADLRAEMLSQDLRKPGRVTRLERGEYFAWRALAEVRAFSLAAEPLKSRAVKELQGSKFAHGFDTRAAGRDPATAYEELFAAVAVP